MSHSIHCKGYRGVGNEFDEASCNCKNPMNDGMLIAKTCERIERELQGVLQSGWELAAYNQDSELAKKHVAEYLVSEFTQLRSQLESKESIIERRLNRLADYYERMSKHFMNWDIRGPMMEQASKDMRLVIQDTKEDLGLA